jgi:hypothetical protein
VLHRRHRRLAAALSAVALTAACASDAPETAEPPPADGLGDAAADPPPGDEADEAEPDAGALDADATSPEVVVELLEEGEDPEPLRLAYEAGSTATGTFTFETTVTRFVFDGEAAPSSPAIPIAVDAEVEVVEVVDGVAEVAFRFTDPRVAEDSDLDPELRDEVAGELGALDGAAGSYRVDERGVVVAGDLTLDTTAPELDQLGDELAGMSVPLPEEPVGVGGRWEVRQLTDLGGFVTEQVTTVELVGRDGDVLELAMTIQGSSPSGVVEFPDLPGVEVNVVRSDLRGEGTSEQSLREPMPRRGESSGEGEQVFELEEDGRVVTLEQTMRIVMSLERT